jgi:PIN domain nuclease of toxin-antitoxin system
MNSDAVSTASPVLLDTCTFSWLMDGEPLSDASRDALLVARSSRSGIYVSPVTAWELGTLIAKGRYQITLTPEVWFDTLLAVPGVKLAALTPQLLLSSTALPGNPPNDPAGCILAATARTHGYTLITRDRLLLDYARQGHITAIKS